MTRETASIFSTTLCIGAGVLGGWATGSLSGFNLLPWEYRALTVAALLLISGIYLRARYIR